MILVLGGTGYVGEAFVADIQRRGWEYRNVSRSEVDYSNFDALLGLLRQMKPEFVVNCAGYTGKPNVDACETAKADTLQGNALLPATIAHACAAAGIPWGHVSSGCIYAGAKIRQNDDWVVEKDLTRAELRALAEQHPDQIGGFTEEDVPNFSFREPPCSFYSGTKALGEEAIGNSGSAYVWRLRIPFDELDNPRNYLTKVQRYAKVYDNVNSISHRADYARACLDLWALKAPFGKYNVVNPGFVTTKQVIEKLERILKPNRKFEFWKDDAEFYQVAAKTPRSNCVMEATKLLKTGVKIRTVDEALEHSLQHWKPQTV